MERKFKIYLFFCVVMFFVFSSIFLFHSFGYKYDFNENKAIQVGAMTIEATPKDFEVYINGKIIQRNPAISNLFESYIKIDDLNSGTYSVEIKKDGYFSWNKNVEVNSGYVTEIKNVVLLRKKYEENVLAYDLDANCNSGINLWLGKNKNRIAYKKRINGGLKLFIFDFDKSSDSPVANLEELKPMELEKEYNFCDLIWSEDDKKIVFKINSENNYFWYFANLEKGEIYNLKTIFGKNADIDSKQIFIFGDYLFYLKDNAVYKLNFKNFASTKILENVSRFLIKENRFYYFKNNDNKFYSSYLNGAADSPSIEFSMTDDFNSNSISEIIKAKGKSIFIILSDEKKLYFIDEIGKIFLVSLKANGGYFTSDNKKIIYYNNNEVWICYLEKGGLDEISLSKELITRYSGNITNVILYKDNNHIFYKEGDILKFAELNGSYKRNIFDVLDIKGNDIFYLKNKNRLVYLKKNQLREIKLENSR